MHKIRMYDAYKEPINSQCDIHTYIKLLFLLTVHVYSIIFCKP